MGSCLLVTFTDAGARQRLVTPCRLGSVVSGDAHVRACVLRREARDYVQCDAPRFCGIPSKWNIERQPMARERRRIPIRSMSAEDAALASIGSRECDESLHLARGPNFEFHARSIGRYLRDGRSRSGTFVNTRPLDVGIAWIRAPLSMLSSSGHAPARSPCRRSRGRDSRTSCDLRCLRAYGWRSDGEDRPLAWNQMEAHSWNLAGRVVLHRDDGRERPRERPELRLDPKGTNQLHGSHWPSRPGRCGGPCDREGSFRSDQVL